MSTREAVAITGWKQKQAWDKRALPPVEEVRPGLWSIPVPMGSNPLRYSYAYAFVAADALVVVDPGWPASESFEALAGGLAAAGRSPADVTGILVTHAHHDHFGLVDRLREASGAWVAMNSLDAELQILEGDDFAAILDARREWLGRCGADTEDALTHGSDLEIIKRSAVRTRCDRHLEDGERIRVGRFDIQAIWTPGHSPGHMVFHERTQRILLSGDHVLPRITPNISAFVGGQSNCLRSYLESLRKIRKLEVTEVLPGHGYRFSGLPSRVDAIRSHHERRLVEISDVIGVDECATPWDISARLTWSRPWSSITAFSRRAAVGETLAHLHLLQARGGVQLVDDGATWRWSRISPSGGRP